MTAQKGAGCDNHFNDGHSGIFLLAGSPMHRARQANCERRLCHGDMNGATADSRAALRFRRRFDKAIPEASVAACRPFRC
ncbi:hypothetical protein AB9F34_33320, partial [Rhizobium leguminosarum]|uniref:hypothetical protein n=1 Tax=Rhizobium leguminosarum TaxID=384 RepID=UPI003F959DE4